MANGNRRYTSLANQAEKAAKRIHDKSAHFTPKALIMLSKLYQQRADGLSTNELIELLEVGNSTVGRLANQLTSVSNKKHPPLGLCTYERENGSGREKVLRFSAEGQEWYEENVLDFFNNNDPKSMQSVVDDEIKKRIEAGELKPCSLEHVRSDSFTIRQ